MRIKTFETPEKAIEFIESLHYIASVFDEVESVTYKLYNNVVLYQIN